MASKKNNPSAKNDPLSDKWYTLKQVCKMLDISISCSKGLRKRGALIVSKRFGKLYVNEYHYQKYLRDGLPSIFGFLVLAAQSANSWDMVFTS